MKDLLVLGLGNLLCEDDGAGVVAVRRLLEQWEPPSGVEVLDGGTLGLSLLPLLEDARALLIVDAVLAEGPPGTLVRLEGKDVPRAALERLSPHQIGVADLLHGALWSGRMPDRLVLLGVVPDKLWFGVQLTAAVERAIPELVRRTVDAARELGFDFRPRNPQGAAASG